MDVEKQLELCQQERDIATEKWKQSQRIIEKLEEEMKNVRQRYFEKEYVDTMKIQYSNVIRMLEKKCDKLQQQYDVKITDVTAKQHLIDVLTKEKSVLEKRCQQFEEECIKLQSMYQHTKDDHLLLESKILNSSSILRYNENKKIFRSSVEAEHKKLCGLINKLSNDCGELEKALEVCHDKIQHLQNEHTILDKTRCQLSQENSKLQQENQTIRGKITRLAEENKSLTDERLNRIDAEILRVKQDFNYIFRLYLDKFEQLMIEKSTCEKTKIRDINEDNFLSSETRNSLQSFINKLYDNRSEQNRLRLDISHLGKKLIKCKQYLSNGKHATAILQQDLLAAHNELQYKTKLIEKAKDNNAVNVEMEKYIQSHKVLYDKWKKEVADLISKFRNRISHLKKCYSKSQKENAQLKSLIESHVKAVRFVTK